MKITLRDFFVVILLLVSTWLVYVGYNMVKLRNDTCYYSNGYTTALSKISTNWVYWFFNVASFNTLDIYNTSVEKHVLIQIPYYECKGYQKIYDSMKKQVDDLNKK